MPEQFTRPESLPDTSFSPLKLAEQPLEDPEDSLEDDGGVHVVEREGLNPDDPESIRRNLGYIDSWMATMANGRQDEILTARDVNSVLNYLIDTVDYIESLAEIGEDARQELERRKTPYGSGSVQTSDIVAIEQERRAGAADDREYYGRATSPDGSGKIALGFYANPLPEAHGIQAMPLGELLKFANEASTIPDALKAQLERFDNYYGELFNYINTLRQNGYEHRFGQMDKLYQEFADKLKELFPGTPQSWRPIAPEPRPRPVGVPSSDLPAVAEMQQPTAELPKSDNDIPHNPAA